MPLVLRAKCILVGDSEVGKSALTQSFASDGTQFPKTYSMTTGVDICVKAIQIPNTDITVEFFIHDCAGKDLFGDYIQKFWDGPGMVIVMYDLTNEQSFNSCSKWLNRVKAKKFSPDSYLPGVLVGNKTDLESQRVVVSEIGEKFASDNSLEYFECCVKHHENCDAPFLSLAEKFHKHYEEKLETFKMLT